MAVTHILKNSATNTLCPDRKTDDLNFRINSKRNESVLNEGIDRDLVQFQHHCQICSMLYSLYCCVMDNG